MIGKTLAHYRILEEIGRGGMGVVYKALDTRLGRSVAIKVLPPELVTDPERRARLIREARAAAQIQHPGVCTVHAIEQDGGVDFIVMELVEGRSLAARLTEGPLPLPQVLKIGIELAEAIAEAHRHQVVHRDLKPGNVLLTASGRAKVTDFGLAKVLSPPEGRAAELSDLATLEADLTTQGQAVGTVRYMAPEQIRGESLTPAVDLFALGVVLYEMIAGRRPFEGATPLETIGGILRDEPPPLPAETPPRLSTLCRRLLAKRPAGRPDSAEEVARELGEILAERDKPARRPAAWALAALAIALVAGLLLWRDKWRPPAPPTGAQRSIAVMYFENLSGERELDRVALSLPELIAADLGQFPEQIQVMSSQRIHDLKKQIGKGESRVDKDLASEIARRDGIESILVGGIHRLGERYVLTAELVEVASGRIRGTEKVDGTDIYDLVDRLGPAIRSHLELESAPSAPQRAADLLTDSLTALGHYADGLQRLYTGRYAEAAALFERAVADDPDFALACYQLAVAYDWIGDDQKERRALEQGLRHVDKLSQLDRLKMEAMQAFSDRDDPRAVSLLTRLRALAPTDKDVYYRLMELYFHSPRYRDWSKVIEMGSKAVGLDPDFSLAYIHLVDAVAKRNAREAHGYAQRLQSIDPKSGIPYQLLGMIHARLGDGESAGAAFARARELAPEDPQLRFNLVPALMTLGHYSEAIRLGSSRPDTSTDVGVMLVHFTGSACFLSGRIREAMRFWETARAHSETMPPPETNAPAWSLADVHLARGDLARARNLAEEALASQTSRGHHLLLEIFPPERARELLEKERERWRPWALDGGFEARSVFERIEGELALLEGRLGDAETHFQRGVPPGAPKEEPLAPLLCLARLDEKRGMLEQAALQYEKLTAVHHIELAFDPFVRFEALAKLGELNEKLSRRDEALRFTRQFLEHWGEADVDLPQVAEARARLARVGGVAK